MAPIMALAAETGSAAPWKKSDNQFTANELMTKSRPMSVCAKGSTSAWLVIVTVVVAAIRAGMAGIIGPCSSRLNKRKMTCIN